MKQQVKNNASKASNAKMMEAKMKAAKHVNKHGRSEPWSNGERCDPKKESQIRNARHRHAQLMHSPTCTAHVHSRWMMGGCPT